MKKLFAPWRMKYIKEVGKKSACFICEASNKGDQKQFVITEGKTAIVIANSYPYNPGHVMVCPKRHVKFPYELTKEESCEVMELLSLMVKALSQVYKPEGFNIGVNIGRASGAGEEHLHFHIVPRWSGDTNFMPLFAETKVLPESVEDTCKRLREALKEIF